MILPLRLIKRQGKKQQLLMVCLLFCIKSHNLPLSKILLTKPAKWYVQHPKIYNI